MIPCFFLVWYNRYVFKCLNYSDDLVQTFFKKCYVKVGANVISNSAHENKSLLPWLQQWLFLKDISDIEVTLHLASAKNYI